MKTFLLTELIESAQEGRAHIVGEDIEWCLDIAKGQLLFAAHSLQNLTAFESVLPGLGYEAALPTYWRLVSMGPYKRKINEKGLHALGWSSRVVEALVQYKTLNREQAEKVLAKLSEDAIADLLRLGSATVNWQPLPVGTWHLRHTGIAFAATTQTLLTQLKGWQKLSDRIVSPHQRPYCDNPEDINQPVPQGLLPHHMLEALNRLMQGSSIRQLAQVIKQDELKLAQLLYPYIQHRVIKLWPPVAPLDQLPWIPTKAIALPSIDRSAISATQSAPHATTPAAPETPAVSPDKIPQNSAPAVDANRHPQTNHPSPSNKPPDEPSKTPSANTRDRHLIVCIDDNQLILNKINDYLDPNQFELQAVLDPLGSIAKICAMKPDLVLLDISMPRIDGHNLCRLLRRSVTFKKIPIIMISSSGSAVNKAKAQSVGATDYLEKPFSQTQLMALIETYLAPSG